MVNAIKFMSVCLSRLVQSCRPILCHDFHHTGAYARSTFESRDFSAAGPTVWDGIHCQMICRIQLLATFSTGLINAPNHWSLRSVSALSCSTNRY